MFPNYNLGNSMNNQMGQMQMGQMNPMNMAQFQVPQNNPMGNLNPMGNPLNINMPVNDTATRISQEYQLCQHQYSSASLLDHIKKQFYFQIGPRQQVMLMIAILFL